MSKKKLNKTVWYGSDVDSQGNAILPPLAEGREDLNGIHEGEIYLHNQDDDPSIWVRTDKGNIKRIGFNKQDLDLSEYLKKQVWDTAWELRTTVEGESYIFCKLPFISQYGITLYADGGNIDLPSLYAGIPVDGTTITKREDGTLMLNPNLELGGLDEEALQKYLDDYNYAKLTDVDSRINDLINGAPAAYDTLKEIADVLQGNVNSIGDIITTLGTKADKTYVDTELAKYIPIAGDTEVAGVKNFLSGLKVGGLPISKYEGHDDVIYIDANVVLRGGLTQYAVDPVTIPSIIESLPQAGYESKGVASFSSDFFAIDANGKVSIIPDSVGLNEEELEEWLADSDYATKTYADDRYFLASNFTKANIVAKLGISDWALESTKPSYTTKEVTEDTNLYFTNQRAIEALTDTLKAYVTLQGTQTIEGEKDFTGGLKVNGSPIVYDSENGYWLLQGNLLITGGLTQYVDDGSVNLPNLYDGLPIDRDTIYWDNGVLKAKVAEGGITSITSQMVIDALGFTPYDATNPNGYITSAALNDYQTKITSTNKLAYSLISGTPDLSVYLTTSSASSTYQPKITSSAKLAASLVSGLATVATSGSYNDLSNKPTIPTNTNQLTNGAGFITSSASITGNAATASLIKPTSGTYQASTWNPLTSYTKIWGEAFINSAITSDSGDMIFYLRPSVYNSGTTELCVAIDGDFYAQLGTKKVWHEGNFTPSNYLPLSFTALQTIQGGNLSLPITIKTSSTHNHITFYATGADAEKAAFIGVISDPRISGGSAVFGSDGGRITIPYSGGIYYQTTYNTTPYKIWHEGNDGSGSGLDADTLDGLRWNSFMRQFGYITSANTGNALLAGTFRFQSVSGTGLPTGAVDYGTMLTVRGGEGYDTLWQMYGNYNNDILFYRRGNLTSLASNAWKQIAFTDSNVSSATKLQTARTIWGQSFDGTGNVSGNINTRGNIYVTSSSATTINESSGKIKFNSLNENNDYRSPYIQAIHTDNYSRKRLSIFQSNEAQYDNEDGFFEAFTVTSSGNVGIGTTSPAQKLHVVGNIQLDGYVAGRKWTLSNGGGATFTAPASSGWAWSLGNVSNSGTDLGSACGSFGTGGTLSYHFYGGAYSSATMYITPNNRVGILKSSPGATLHVGGEVWADKSIGASTYMYAYSGVQIGSTSDIGWYPYNSRIVAGMTTARGVNVGSLLVSNTWADYTNVPTNGAYIKGNFLCGGGITQYSDIRKKTKLQDVELTLKQVANAPLIEHYYNSDDKKTTHVGSIAQYWAEMNDWFCKLDSDGYYTMEIQNAALASAISIARELERYESKTDKKIRLLKKRINELEDEIEKLKNVA